MVEDVPDPCAFPVPKLVESEPEEIDRGELAGATTNVTDALCPVVGVAVRVHVPGPV